RRVPGLVSLGGRVRAGEGMATLRIGPATDLRVVDAVLTGVHEPGTSHHELLRAFVDDATLLRVDTELMGRGYRTHEFGDSALIERSRAAEADGTPGGHSRALTGNRIGNRPSSWLRQLAPAPLRQP